ncbi:hypothetical protein ACIQOV_04165 [Kitasatospora sp. NPDC091257]|uniref:hypothetical protein n=1 Tax=Kitasatospora sp. NPDC091257 TaxID=3364084 RepID=UPI0038235A76
MVFAATVSPAVFLFIPKIGRPLALDMLRLGQLVAATVGIAEKRDPDFAARTLEFTNPWGKFLAVAVAAAVVYRFVANLPGPFGGFRRNRVPARCVMAIAACGYDAGMEVRAPDGTVITPEPDASLATPRGNPMDVSYSVRATARSLLRMHRHRSDLSRGRRRQMKIHCARVAATLYQAELKIDVAPEEGRRELAEMLAEVAENFAAKRFSALYPDEKLLPKPAHDWDRLRSIGCAAAGVLLLWWLPATALSTPVEAD